MIMLHPIDPVAIAVGPLSIRWYALMYLLGFALFIGLGKYHIRRRADLNWNSDQLYDLLFYGMLGVIVGGRLGEVLFFQPGYYFSHPLKILAIWEGGMSFHGGFLGVLVAAALYARHTQRTFWQVTDFVAPLVPTGLMAGRIGNFINGELIGRPASADLPWSVVFSWVDQIPRHPSTLYQAAGEGLLLFIILWIYARKPRPIGATSALFLLGYAVLRFSAEFFRMPDPGIFGTLSLGLSTAQWLCVPMGVIGVWLLWRTTHGKPLR